MAVSGGQPLTGYAIGVMEPAPATWTRAQALAARAPASRPKTAPDINPVPPG